MATRAEGTGIQVAGKRCTSPGADPGRTCWASVVVRMYVAAAACFVAGFSRDAGARVA